MSNKIPLRRCNGCMEMKPKSELVRIVKSTDDIISLDLTGKKNGRGAYICNDIECLKKARKSKRINREFKCEIPDEIYDLMEEQITDR